MVFAFSDSIFIIIRGILLGFAGGFLLCLFLLKAIKKILSGRGFAILTCFVFIFAGGLLGISLSLNSAARRSFDIVVEMIEPDIRIVLQKATVDPDRIPVGDFQKAANLILDEGRKQVSDKAGYLSAGKTVLAAFDRTERMLTTLPVMNQTTATTKDFFRDIQHITLSGVRYMSLLLACLTIIATIIILLVFFLVDSSDKKEAVERKSAEDSGQIFL